MIRNNNYKIVKVNNNTHLFPIGQASADRLNVVTLNEDGLKIWNLLDHETTISEIVSNLCDKDLGNKASVADTTAVVTDFLRVLRSQNMLVERESFKDCFNKSTASKSVLKIADALICIKSGFDIFSIDLSAFKIPYDDSFSFDQCVTFDFGFNKPSENGEVIIRNDFVTIMDLTDKYILLYGKYTCIREVHISKDYRYVCVYATGIPGETLKTEFSLALRDCVLMMLSKRGFIMLHSSSILYNGKLFCFSAASGTGKSTHVSLWSKRYDTPVINGDLNLCGLSDNTVTVYGTPWCGTSEIFSKETYPLGGIVFLSRSEVDTAAQITVDAALPQFIRHITTPYYTESDFTRISKTASDLAPYINFYTLGCTMNDTSVEAIKPLLN